MQYILIYNMNVVIQYKMHFSICILFSSATTTNSFYSPYSRLIEEIITRHHYQSDYYLFVCYVLLFFNAEQFISTTTFHIVFILHLSLTAATWWLIYFSFSHSHAFLSKTAPSHPIIYYIKSFSRYSAQKIKNNLMQHMTVYSSVLTLHCSTVCVYIICS